MSMQVPGTIVPSQVPPTSAAHVAAFEATQAEIAALPVEKLSTIFVDVIAVSSRVVASATVAAKYDAELAELPGTQGLRPRVIRHAHAAAYAQHLLNGGDVPAGEIAPMVEELRVLRERFHADAKALVVRKVLKAEQIEEVSGSLAFNAVTREVQHLCFVFRNNWSKIAGRSGLSLEEVEAAILLAERCEAEIALKEKTEAAKVDAADVRQRAFTLLDLSYNELRRALAHILWNDPDELNEIAPPIAAQRTRGKRKNEPAVDATLPIAGPGPVVAPFAGGGVAAPAPLPAPGPVNGGPAGGGARPGMPDAGPFVK